MTGWTVIDVTAAAKLIGRTEGATRQLIARKQLPHRKAGSRIVLFQEEILAWLESRPGVRLEDIQANPRRG